MPIDYRALRQRLEALPLRIDAGALEPRSLALGEWTRESTEVVLRGAGEEGRGEDVTYTVADQRTFRARGLPADWCGDWTLAGFSAGLDAWDAFPEPPEMPASLDYRRWAAESAALDLALRQAGTTLGELAGLTPRPARFVLSMGLGDPPDLEPLQAWRTALPGIGFKLDASPAWTEAVCAELAALGGVEVVDLKGYYEGTVVDQPVDRALYARVVESFPEAWIEDALWTPETAPVLQAARARLSWDAPIHRVADLDALPLQPRVLNVKPSRSGRLGVLLDLYRACAERGIQVYGGGQFELGVGRRQILELAALFHPEASNDVAPAEFHGVRLDGGRRGPAGRPGAFPRPPLAPPAARAGFGTGLAEKKPSQRPGPTEFEEGPLPT